MTRSVKRKTASKYRVTMKVGKVRQKYSSERSQKITKESVIQEIAALFCYEDFGYVEVGAWS
jgi:hypothetical protein